MVARKTDPAVLSREAILAAAGELVAEGGARSLSMRRLARRLDVWPMSIYTYFEDKDDLLEALAAGAAGAVEVPGPGPSWRERIIELLDGMREALGEEPARAFLRPETLRLSDAGLAMLGEAGLDPSQAARCWRALWAYTAGFAAFDLGADPDAARRRVRIAVAELDGGPALGSGEALADAFAAGHDRYRSGLQLLLDGIERA